MARPKKKPESLKDTDLRIPVTASDKQLIQNAAALAGMDMAAWVRPILRAAAEAEIAGRQKSKK